MRWLVVAWLLLWTPALAHAHSQSTARVDIRVVDDGPGAQLQVEVDIALRDLALTLPLDADGDDAVTWGELVAVRAGLEAMVLDGLRLGLGGQPCTLVPEALAVRRYDDGTYATLQLGARCAAGAVDQADRIAVGYRLLFDRDPGHRAMITVQGEDGAATAVAHAGQPDVSIPLSGTHQFATFLREGVHHILIGYDHLAFLLSLLLTAPLVRRKGEWRRAASFRASVLHVLGIVTAFTVAHSITLGLAALGWVTPSSRWVEAAIALSVLLAALNNLRPLLVRRLWVAGSLFGLVHGFGFAGVLQEVGLPDDARLLALLGFNLGVELGQVAVVALVLPLLFLCGRQAWYPRIVMPLASMGIAGLAVYWLLQRLAG